MDTTIVINYRDIQNDLLAQQSSNEMEIQNLKAQLQTIQRQHAANMSAKVEQLMKKSIEIEELRKQLVSLREKLNEQNNK